MIELMNRTDHSHDNDVIMNVIASQITSLTIVYSNIYSGTDQRKHQSSASLAFVRGIRWSPVNSSHKGPVTWKMFPFDDVIMFTFTRSHSLSISLTHSLSLALSCQKLRFVMMPTLLSQVAPEVLLWQPMMASSSGNIFCVTGPLCGEFTGHKGQWHGALMFSLICIWINSWINNHEAGDLRCYHAHYDVIVMHQCHQ